ncbi:hypothetical protein Y032_0042g583 [Ancylostoma ceylanicum]|nr:hypothetical protein Y032_0042g583 [Ancylostoma ceylanicum]
MMGSFLLRLLLALALLSALASSQKRNRKQNAINTSAQARIPKSSTFSPPYDIGRRHSDIQRDFARFPHIHGEGKGKREKIKRRSTGKLSKKPPLQRFNTV